MQPRDLARDLSIVAIAVAASLLAAGPARAQEQPAPVVSAAPAGPPERAAGFGETGALVFTYQTADPGTGYFLFHKTSGGGSTFQLNPSVDYFLAPSISLGATVMFTHDSGGGNSYGAGVHAGYNLNVNAAPAVGFWPMARFFVIHSPQVTSTEVSIFAPFLWHLVPHFFLGAGPSLQIGLSGGSYTQYGIDFMLGGWI
ncbi:MAG TPA: hypothetical protein VMT03_06920 [Polyangia bacterium]|nr:hypothetical protein [Polyangia bacterium]